MTYRATPRSHADAVDTVHAVHGALSPQMPARRTSPHATAWAGHPADGAARKGSAQRVTVRSADGRLAWRIGSVRLWSGRDGCGQAGTAAMKAWPAPASLSLP